MKIHLRLRFVILLSLCLLTGVGSAHTQSAKGRVNTNQPRYPCLQEPTNLDDIVAFGRSGSSNITVKDRLTKLKARCYRGKLVDGRRREIRFFKAECWGNPPADYLDILRKQREEIVKLKKKYTVVEMSCNRIELSKGLL